MRFHIKLTQFQIMRNNWVTQFPLAANHNAPGKIDSETLLLIDKQCHLALQLETVHIVRKKASNSLKWISQNHNMLNICLSKFFIGLKNFFN